MKSKPTNMETRCYFNLVQVSERPYKIDGDCPYLDLDVRYATDLCEKLLDAELIDSYCIPAFTDHAVQFLVEE